MSTHFISSDLCSDGEYHFLTLTIGLFDSYTQGVLENCKTYIFFAVVMNLKLENVTVHCIPLTTAVILDGLLDWILISIPKEQLPLHLFVTIFLKHWELKIVFCNILFWSNHALTASALLSVSLNLVRGHYFLVS